MLLHYLEKQCENHTEIQGGKACGQYDI